MGSVSGTGELRGIPARLRARFREWVNRRIPPAKEVTLDQRRIFIFPSSTGLFFGICLLVMLVAAINFENNLSYALTFLLATLFVVAVLHTYANLSGLTVKAVRAQSAFPGQQAEFQIMIERTKQRHHYALYMKWPDSSEALVNLIEEDSALVQLHMPVGRRGWFSPGRLLLESTYPLGLLRCWTWIDLDLHALVYPQPLQTQERSDLATESPEGAVELRPGNDDFYGLRPYRSGDSPRLVHWKGVAKGQGLHTKHYTAYSERSLWLDWLDFSGGGLEQSLSWMCYWALEYHASGDEYGLRMPGLQIEPASGERHRDEVLRTLALFERHKVSE